MKSVYQTLLDIPNISRQYGYCTKGSVFKTFALSIDILGNFGRIVGKYSKGKNPRGRTGGRVGSNTFRCKSPNVDVDCCDATDTWLWGKLGDLLETSFFLSLLSFFLFTILNHHHIIKIASSCLNNDSCSNSLLLN